ncbi:hypothetical protein ACFQ3R_09160 [Mesonia ostreae]|uniref:Secreted protein n=1 Tax=Mesonia ostreae TaxID=861110 RepID=A0ABU2KEP4_9FLAO|nr:hypothetical protein [Mesonia ostreae]MDT0293164.1 hypothetical protein [Mesonia ostreae]
MKKFLHNAMAVFMVAVVLMTTMSFTVDMHYCGETLVDFSFTQQVETCRMENNKNESLGSCESPKMSKESCCSDKQLVQEGQDNLKTSFDQLTLEQQIFVTSFTYTYINLFEGTESKQIPFVDYAPPFVKRDVQVLHQTFLI